MRASMVRALAGLAFSGLAALALFAVGTHFYVVSKKGRKLGGVAMCRASCRLSPTACAHPPTQPLSHAPTHAPTHSRLHALRNPRIHAHTHSEAHASMHTRTQKPTHPCTQAPTHPRPHPPAHSPSHAHTLRTHGTRFARSYFAYMSTLASPSPSTSPLPSASASCATPSRLTSPPAQGHMRSNGARRRCAWTCAPSSSTTPCRRTPWTG